MSITAAEAKKLTDTFKHLEVERLEKLHNKYITDVENKIHESAAEGYSKVYVPASMFDNVLGEHFVNLGYEIRLNKATSPSLGDKDEYIISW